MPYGQPKGRLVRLAESLPPGLGLLYQVVVAEHDQAVRLQHLGHLVRGLAPPGPRPQLARYLPRREVAVWPDAPLRPDRLAQFEPGPASVLVVTPRQPAPELRSRRWRGRPLRWRTHALPRKRPVQLRQ